MDAGKASGTGNRVWTEDDYMQGRMPPERAQLERAPAQPAIEFADFNAGAGALQQSAPADSLAVSSAFTTGPNADLNNLRAAELGHFVLEVLDEPEKLYVHAPEGIRQILISYLDKNQLVSILRNPEVRDLLKLSAENFRFLQTVLSRYESSLKRVDVAQGHETVAADLLADWEETHRPTLHSFSIMRQHNAQLSPAEFASAHKDSIGYRKAWRPLSLMMAALWAGTGASYRKLQSLNPEHPFQSDQPDFLSPSDTDKWTVGAFYACTIVGALLSLSLIIQFCATLSARVREGRQDMSVALSKNAEKATTRVNTAQSRVDEMEGFVVQELERVGGPADGPRLEEIIEFPRQAAGASSATSTYAGGAGLFGPLEDWSTKQTGEHEWEMRSDGKDPVTLDRAQLRLIRALRDGDVVSRTDLETALEDASANVEDRLNGMAQKFAALGVTLERPEEGSYRLQRSDA